MIIKVDQEGQKALIEVLDVAIKAVGLQGLGRINQIIGTIVLIDESKKQMEIVKNESTE